MLHRMRMPLSPVKQRAELLFVSHLFLNHMYNRVLISSFSSSNHHHLNSKSSVFIMFSVILLISCLAIIRKLPSFNFDLIESMVNAL
jgi:hypothetical protein